MRISRLLALLFLVRLHDAAAQAPATVTITAPRPTLLDGYRATEARIRNSLSQRPGLSSPFLSWCMENRFADENASFPGRPLPVATQTSLDIHIKCARTHIEAKDTTLEQALQAFDRRDYPAALGLFEQAYAKLGNQDAALMLAKMRLDGLGVPKDAAGAIKWLRAVAEDRFDPWRDSLRFDPQHPQATNARIEAALLLARIYERGDGVQQDWTEAQNWHAKAAAFGFVPDKPRAERQPAQDPPANVARVAGQAPVAVAPAPDEQAPPIVTVAPAQGKTAHSDAPEQDDAGAFMRVRITGLRAVPWKSYRAIRAALAAYDKYRYLAPDAVFRFAVQPSPGQTLPPNFKLRVRTRDGQEFPVPLENGELFEPPVLPDPTVDAELVSNLKGGPLRIGLLVHTRGVPPEKERLGDVRLRAEINLAISDVDHPGDNPACQRKLLRQNDCRHPRLSVWHKPRAPASGAWLIDGGRREALQSNGDRTYPSYRMPINAGHLSNDAIIEFDYRTPPGPLTLAEVAIYEGDD